MILSLVFKASYFSLGAAISVQYLHTSQFRFKLTKKLKRTGRGRTIMSTKKSRTGISNLTVLGKSTLKLSSSADYCHLISHCKSTRALKSTGATYLSSLCDWYYVVDMTFVMIRQQCKWPICIVEIKYLTMSKQPQQNHDDKLGHKLNLLLFPLLITPPTISH